MKSSKEENASLMRAAIYKHYGKPEVVQIAQILKPVPKPNEVLVEVHYSTINRTDCAFRSAENMISRLFSGFWRPKQPVLGCEFSGIITATGEEVTRFQVGEAVFGFDEQKFGSHAAFKTIAENGAIAKKPASIEMSHAAALLEGSHYALVNIRATKTHKGQTVLVYGATGAIGSAAVQLLKAMDVRVLAVCGTKHIEDISKLGADRMIDYQQEDYTLCGEKVDFVFDAVGKTSFLKAKKILNPNGIYISTELGKGWANIWFALLTPIFRKKKVLFPIPSISQEDAEFLKQLVETNQFSPLVDRTYPLNQIVEGYHYVESGQKRGNVLLEIKTSDNE